jgi:hypothetical protein
MDDFVALEAVGLAVDGRHLEAVAHLLGVGPIGVGDEHREAPVGDGHGLG